MERRRERRALSEAQRRLVQENLGLITVHLRRYVANLARPKRDREWDDLFQEGCLGLANAAERFRPEQGISFPAFALPRIHNAVSRAIHLRFSTIRPPVRHGHSKKKRASKGAPGSYATESPTDDSYALKAPKAVEFPAHFQFAQPNGTTLSACDAQTETIGQRMRQKYECAMRAAARIAAGQHSIRGDRGTLVDLLVRERLLVPESGQRRAMRQIARDTHSSYARVAHCEKQLTDFVRDRLAADPEFMALWRIAHGTREGYDAHCDVSVEREVVEACTEEFERRFRHADRQTQATLLYRVLRLSQARTVDIASRCFSRLSRRVRERVLEVTAGLAEVSQPTAVPHCPEQRRKAS